MTANVQINIDHVDRLGILLRKPKRIKILVGGRASTKSTFVADHCLAQVAQGKVWCCGREYQNSIDDSVHSLLTDEIDRLGFPGFDVLRTEINHRNGGRAFYRGLARNIASLKGIHCDVLWIEEGETSSDNTLRVLTASIRASAKKQQEAKEQGREIEFSEIWITMNRGSSKDAISQRYLKRAESELARCGFYEDDLVMIVEINYDENPWFIGSGLETERLDDKQYLSNAAYEHKWGGAYSDTVENAIIEPEWFDACIDAHLSLGFKPEGFEVVSHDPFDGGKDAAALTHTHGNVVVYAEESRVGKVNDACEWALNYVERVKPDAFIWDSDGVGAGLKRQIADVLDQKKVAIHMFSGGGAVANPDSIYNPTVGTVMQAKTNREAFFNRRAQRYWNVRDKVFNTYLAITQKKYTDPSNLISFSSDITCMPTLRAELCRIPRKPGVKKIQILSKVEMLKEDIESPNIGDCIMMTEDVEMHVKTARKLNFTNWSHV